MGAQDRLYVTSSTPLGGTHLPKKWARALAVSISEDFPYLLYLRYANANKQEI
jgi:hypothetical protein